jgi:hypothetical protein
MTSSTRRRRGRSATLAFAATVIVLMVSIPVARAGQADVVSVDAVHEGGGTWRFSVTVRHEDRDPDHWADWWRARTPEGRELGRRVLLHSHVDEQPFTRDERISIPAGTTVVVVEAHDKRHGLGGRTVTVDLGRASGPGYRVTRPR